MPHRLGVTLVTLCSLVCCLPGCGESSTDAGGRDAASGPADAPAVGAGNETQHAVSESIFADMTIPEAVEAAGAKSGMVVIKFTAEWCGPCKQMDRTTWVDESVKAWIRRNGVAVEVDVDDEPELSQQYAVASMPTIAILRDGEVFDRMVGYRDADQMLEWFADVEQGVPPTERLEARWAGRESLSTLERYLFASELLNTGLYELAHDEYVYLWTATRRSASMAGVRLSSMLSDIERLIEARPESHEPFVAFRDEVEQQINTRRGHQTRIRIIQEWIALNGIVGEDDRTIQWYLEHFDVIESTDEMAQAYHALFHDLLLDRDMWELYASTLEDPDVQIRFLTMQRQITETMVGAVDTEGHITQALDEHFRQQVATAYAGYLVRRKHEWARTAEQMLLEELDDPESRIAMVEAALDAGAVTSDALRLLDEASAGGEDPGSLREQVERALASASGDMPG